MRNGGGRADKIHSGRIQCRRRQGQGLPQFAASRQADTNVWDEVAGLIPLMREDSILEDESVRLGKFNGEETLEYVDSVMSHYEAICRICPQT